MPNEQQAFGATVAICGDLALVDSALPLCIYHNISGTWMHQQTIQGTGGFGSSLSIDPSAAAFAVRDSSPDIRVFRFNGLASAWKAVANIKPPQAGASHSARFSLDGTRLASRVFVPTVGSHVAVYQNNAGNDWTSIATFNYGNPASNFGSTLKLRGDVIIAGDSLADTASSTSGPASYARLSGAAWTQAAQLRTPDWLPADQAHVTDFHADTAVVGAPGDAVNGITSGAAYLFTLTCAGDFDHSGFVDTDDFDAFINTFIDAAPAADVDHSGFVDTDDFTFFVHQFELGC